MAYSDEEANPLMENQVEETGNAWKGSERADVKYPDLTSYGADASRLDQVQMERGQWQTGLLACFGRTDEFCGSDLEVCLSGSVCPCVLYGSTAERLGVGAGSSTFSNHCLTYAGLYLIGNSFFGYNCLAPWFSYPTRTSIRQKFNLEGSCEGLNRCCGGCCGGMMEDEEQREQCESACDFAAHVFCHPCAICQEGREVRRRLPHPSHAPRPVLLMMPPPHQSMPYPRASP